jgi:protease I
MKVLMVLPQEGFDPTEASIPWLHLTTKGYQVDFATPDALPSKPDERVLTKGFGPLSPFLKTNSKVKAVFEKMSSEESFKAPLSFEQVTVSDYQALLIPGGHGPKMKPFLESLELESLIYTFYEQKKILCAICTGVLALARTKTPEGRSILQWNQVTSVTSLMEKTGSFFTNFWLGPYFRLYDLTAQEEITSYLCDGISYKTCWWKCLPFYFKSPLWMQFVVTDLPFITARWPGDVELFSKTIVEELQTYGKKL